MVKDKLEYERECRWEKRMQGKLRLHYYPVWIFGCIKRREPHVTPEWIEQAFEADCEYHDVPKRFRYGLCILIDAYESMEKRRQIDIQRNKEYRRDNPFEYGYLAGPDYIYPKDKEKWPRVRSNEQGGFIVFPRSNS